MAAPGLVIAVTLFCTAPPGSTVAQLSFLNGDGKDLSYTLGGTAPIIKDLAFAADDLVVGGAGIDPAHCGTTGVVTITAKQP